MATTACDDLTAISCGNAAFGLESTGNSSGVHSRSDSGSSGRDFLDGVELIDCTAHNNGPGGSRSGIIIDDVDGDVVISANGIDLRDITGRVLIAGSIASNNAWAGFKVGDVNQGPFFMFDSLSQGNGGEGLVIDPDPTPFEVVQIRWGDASGTSGESPGTGDSVISNSGTVLFDPWLTDVFTSAVNCETFSSGFDSGSLHEWGVILE